MTSYAEFLAAKRRPAPSSGIDVHPDDLLCADWLFPFQRQIVAWAVGRGRAAVWADTGLGKTRMQVAWLTQLVAGTDARGLILAPLAVAHQTVTEARLMGVDVTYVRDDLDVVNAESQIVICNYDRLHLLDPSRFAGVVLDESSILKAFSGKTKRALVSMFADTPYRLSASATPAPNDIEELCNHADFLGVMSPAEMRSTFFIADSRGQFMRYRLKGHAESSYYEWLASWAIAARHPRDLGFDQDGYDLPELTIHDHQVEAGWTAPGQLFTTDLQGVGQRAEVRAATLEARVETAVDLIVAEPDESWLVWCGLNAESSAMAEWLTNALPDRTVVEVVGTDDPDVKAAALAGFAAGDIDILVTKPSIAGAGMNFQRCARMVFVGLGDSYEQYYQAIRRCWRYGQTRPVDVHIVVSDVEDVIVRNVRQKEATASATTDGLIAAVAAENRRELFAGTSKGDDYEPSKPLTVPSWMQEAS